MLSALLGKWDTPQSFQLVSGRCPHPGLGDGGYSVLSDEDGQHIVNVFGHLAPAPDDGDFGLDVFVRDSRDVVVPNRLRLHRKRPRARNASCGGP